MRLLEKGDAAGAQTRFSALFQSHPRDFQLACQIGSALDMSGRHADATSWYQRSLELNSQYAPAKNNLALNYAARGEFAKALPWLDGLTKSKPADARAWYNLGLVDLELGRFAGAALAFQRVRDLDPKNRDAVLRLAYAHLRAGHRVQGISAIRLLATLPGDRRQNALQTAQVLNSARLYREAAKQAEATPAASRSPELELEQATALFHLGEFRHAAETLAKSIPPRGRERDYHTLAGSSAALSGDLPSAVQSMQAAVSAAPRDPEPYYRLALVFVQGGRREEARNVVDVGLEQLPHSALLWYAKAITLLDWGKDEDVIASLDRSVALDPTGADAWTLSGEIEGRVGEYDKALRAFQTALKSGAGSETAVKYAELLIRLERYDDAEKVLQRELKEGAATAHVYRGLGRLYKARREYDQAFDALSRAVKLDPENSDSHFQLAETLRWLGRTEEARREYTLASGKKKAAAEAARLLRRVIVPAQGGM